jgi:hypothetical protein
VPGDLKRARGGKNTTRDRPERRLPVDGQAQHVAVGAAAAAQIAGRQQDPAAQNVHASLLLPFFELAASTVPATSAAELSRRRCSQTDPGRQSEMLPWAHQAALWPGSVSTCQTWSAAAAI